MKFMLQAMIPPGDHLETPETPSWDLGFGIWDLGSGIWDLGFGIWDLGSGVWDL